MVKPLNRITSSKRMTVLLGGISAITLIYINKQQYSSDRKHSIEDLNEQFSNIYLRLHQSNFSNSHKTHNDTGSIYNRPIQPITGFSSLEKLSVQDIYFIKVHKTGSTTLQNILLRYGFDHNLKFTTFNCLYGMAFPNIADPSYIVPNPLKFNTKPNILAEHARFNPDIYKSYMDPKKTKVIGLLRHPYKYLTSLFGFEFLDKRFGLLGKNDPVKMFLENPLKYDYKATWEGGSRDCKPLQKPSVTKNSIAYHFGYEDQFNENRKTMINFIQKLDQNIHLMLILERFDESLILMKKLLNWSTQNILYLPIGSLQFFNRNKYITNLEKEQDTINLHKIWSPVDYFIYEYYYQKLEIILQNQNQDFWEEVKHFKTMVKEVKSYCTSMCSIKDLFSYKIDLDVDEAYKILTENTYVFNESRWHDAIHFTHLDCVKMVLGTEEYQQAIAAKQMPQLCINNQPIPEGMKLKRLYFDKTFCHRESHLVYTYPWHYIKSKIFMQKSSCIKYVNG